jgi:hypothetical protein
MAFPWSLGCFHSSIVVPALFLNLSRVLADMTEPPERQKGLCVTARLHARSSPLALNVKSACMSRRFRLRRQFPTCTDRFVTPGVRGCVLGIFAALSDLAERSDIRGTTTSYCFTLKSRLQGTLGGGGEWTVVHVQLCDGRLKPCLNACAAQNFPLQAVMCVRSGSQPRRWYYQDGSGWPCPHWQLTPTCTVHCLQAKSTCPMHQCLWGC